MKTALKIFGCSIIPIGLTAILIYTCLTVTEFPWWYGLINIPMGLAGFHYIIFPPNIDDWLNTPRMYSFIQIRVMLILIFLGYVATIVLAFIFFEPWWLILIVLLSTLILSPFCGNLCIAIFTFIPVLLFSDKNTD